MILLLLVGACDDLLGPDEDVYWIDVHPNTRTLVTGDTAHFTATAYDSVGFDAGEPLQDVEFTWASEDETIATVDSDGVVTAVGIGEVWITAEAGGTTGSARLTVPDIYWISVLPSFPTISVGETLQFEALAYDSVGFNAGEPLEDMVFVWSSDDENVATVDADGLATGVGSGEAWIHAEVGGVTGSRRLTVEAASSMRAPATPDPRRIRLSGGMTRVGTD